MSGGRPVAGGGNGRRKVGDGWVSHQTDKTYTHKSQTLKDEKEKFYGRYIRFGPASFYTI